MYDDTRRGRLLILLIQAHGPGMARLS